jgi:hypothetical protein
LIITKIATSFAPLRFSSVSGFLFTGLGYYLYTYSRRALHEHGSLLLTTAVIVFMLGLVSEQIALLRMEQRSSHWVYPHDREVD